MTDTKLQRQRAVIYEVNLTVPKARQNELLRWLTPHINEMLALPGFTGAHTMQHDDAQSPEEFSCTVHYHLDSEQSMQQYFERYAEQMRASGLAVFEQDLQATRRVLNSHSALNAEHASLPAIVDPNDFTNDVPSACMDCASSLQGDFCHTCGQRKQRRLVSVFSLIVEFFDGVFNWDSRFWRTMKPLILKPGHLTEAYLNGQRERYIPPVRMYLITSVVFFLLVALGPQKMLQGDSDLTFEALQVEFGDDEDLESFTSGLDVGKNLAIDLKDVAPPSSPPTGNSSANAEDVNENIPPAGPDKPFEKTELKAFCEELADKEKSDISPEALREPIVSTCRSITTRSGARAFIREFFNNLPKMLFVLLPLMALVSKVFYPLSKRYYVEHLLFYVHNYSFLFLFCTILMLSAALLRRFSIEWPEWISIIATLYVAYYFMRSMRVIYRQSRKVTVIKWGGLMIVFFMLSGVVVIGLALGTAVMTA